MKSRRAVTVDLAKGEKSEINRSTSRHDRAQTHARLAAPPQTPSGLQQLSVAWLITGERDRTGGDRTNPDQAPNDLSLVSSTK
jgi:hypothetical protein